MGTGAVLPYYRLVEKTGEGGMGVVWKALATTQASPFAVILNGPETLNAK